MLDEIIKHFGTQAKLAGALGITPVAVTHWKTHGISARQAIEIERLTKGKFKAIDIIDRAGLDAMRKVEK